MEDEAERMGEEGEQYAEDIARAVADHLQKLKHGQKAQTHEEAAAELASKSVGLSEKKADLSSTSSQNAFTAFKTSAIAMACISLGALSATIFYVLRSSDGSKFMVKLNPGSQSERAYYML